MNQVMSSISEGDAASLEQSLRVLRQNAYQGEGDTGNKRGTTPSKQGSAIYYVN